MVFLEKSAPMIQVYVWQGNMEDIEVVQNLSRTIKPEVVFHLSGHVTGAADLKLVLPTFHSLLVSTVNLLTVAANIGCRRIVSLLRGTGTVIPMLLYAAAKWTSGTYGRMFHKLYQTPVVLVRPFMTYGPRQDVRKIIPVTISCCKIRLQN